MLHYGIYTRKSDDDRSVTEKSIGEQLAECKRLVEAAGLEVYKTWEESHSARHPHRRRGYAELIAAIEDGSIQGIVCWHINRLVRNMEEGGKLSQLFIDGRLKEIRTPNAIYRTGDNILPLVIEAASATQFSLDHGRAVERGMNGSFRAGGCTNKAPQGYRNVRDALNLKKGLIERDPDRFELVRRAWDLLLTEGYSVQKIANTMNNAWGFRTRPTRKGGNQPVSYSGLYNIFSNPFYAGYVQRKGEIVKGTHDPMVSTDEYELAQQILHRKSFMAPRVREYAFTGLMKCVHCGQQITAEVKRLRDGRLWENYHCSDAKLQCTKSGLSRSKVEALIITELRSLEIESNALTLAVENVRRFFHISVPEAEDILTAQETALKQTEDRLKRLSDMWLDGIMTDPEQYRENEQRELARKKQITLEMARIQQERNTMQTNLERATRFLASVAEELPTAPDWKKKEICRALATEYVFDGRAKTILINIHPLLMELVSFVKKSLGLEPSETGSQTKEEQPSEKAVLLGGQTSYGLEPSPDLMRALKGELFPDIWCGTDNPREPIMPVARTRVQKLPRSCNDEISVA